jgi:glutamate-1-semialdehyde aminotransferase
VLFAFDEMVTGFRLAFGGGQEYFGITPDFATLGKACGGGNRGGPVLCRAPGDLRRGG